MTMNVPTIAQVDLAVKATLAEFGRARMASSPRSGRVFPGRLLSQRHVEELADPVGTLQVAPGTVITPLARDLLKRRRIEVRWVHRDAVAPAGTFAFAIESSSALVTPLRRALLTE